MALIKAIAHEKGIYEINQKGENLAIKFERDRVDLQKILEFDKKFPGRVKLIPTQKPTVNFKLQDKKRILEEINTVLEYV